MRAQYLISLLILIFLSRSIAQVYTQDQAAARSQGLFDNQNKKYQTSLERMYQTKSIIRTLEPQVLEDILDEITYEVGPGDVLQVHIWGELETDFSAMVNPQGSIILPTVGEIFINRYNLKEAKKKIADAISFKYNVKEFSINLIGLRKFRVYITGEVTLPGTYFAQASDRVSDVLEVAEGVTNWADENKIELRHKDGTTDLIDLNQFFIYGDKLNNPFLRGGDLIYIPEIDVRAGYVIVEGNVKLESTLQIGAEEATQPPEESLFGVYVLKKNEKIYEFLHRIGALTKKVDLRNIMVKRGDERNLINLLDLEGAYPDFVLQNADRIIVPSIIDRVYVRGEVRHPGDYAYFASQRAKDYVGKAGVLNSGAGPEDYVVIRHKTGEYVKGVDVIIENGDTIIVPTSGRYVFRDYLVIITPILTFTATLLLLVTRL